MNSLCLTCHYIDCDWNMQKRILNFCQVTSHTEEVIGKTIEACLLEWGIENVFTITVDNASENDTAIAYLRKRINGWKGSILDGEFLYLRCCAHIVNLIVKEGLKELHHSVESIRNAVNYVKSSPARGLKFKICVEKVKSECKGSLVMDVPTRWNFTYLMLESAVKFQSALERLDEEDSQFIKYFLGNGEGEKKRVGHPTKCDYENAKIFVKFLKTLYDITVKFSASLSPTSNVYYREFCKIQNQLMRFSATGDLLLGGMAASMKTKYDKYWGNIENINCMLFVATVLDLRYKLEYVKFTLEKLFIESVVQGMIRKIKMTLHRMYQQYLKLSLSGSSTQVNQGSSQPSLTKVVVDEDVDDMMVQFVMRKRERESATERNDIDKYLLEPTEDPLEEFDTLGWWKLNSNKYGILSQIARDVLAIQVSTVASESTFSTGGRVLNCFRSSLSPITVEALICSQNWLQSKLEPNESCDYFEEASLYESIEQEFKGLNVSSQTEIDD